MARLAIDPGRPRKQVRAVARPSPSLPGRAYGRPGIAGQRAIRLGLEVAPGTDRPGLPGKGRPNGEPRKNA